MDSKQKKFLFIAILAVNLIAWLIYLEVQGRRTSANLAAGIPSTVHVADKGEPSKVAQIPMPLPEDLPPPVRQNPPPPESLPSFRFCGHRAASPEFGPPAIRLGFSEEVNPAHASDYISSTPPVALSFREEWVYEGSPSAIVGSDPCNLVVRGDFIPGRKYELHISEDLKSCRGKKFVDKGKTVEVLIPDRKPGIRFLSSGGRYLVPKGSMVLPFEAMNVTNINLSVWKILPQNLGRFVMREGCCFRNWSANGDEDNTELLTRFVGRQSYPVTFTSNKTAFVACSLAKIIGEEGRGAYYVRGGMGKEDGTLSKVICVTDLGLSAMVDRENVHVLVTSLSTARPRAGVEVSLLTELNEELAPVLTGADGRACLPVEKEVVPVAAIVHDPSNGDSSFLPLTIAWVIAYGNDGAGHLAQGEYEAFVYTERGIYRPGERVFCETLLRDRDQTAPSPFPVVLKLFGPRGDLLRSIPLMPDETGSARTSIDIPEAYQLGGYRLKLCTPGKDGIDLGETHFKVESIAPPLIRVEVVDIPGRVAAATTDVFTASIASSYLFGAPAAGLSTSASLGLRPVPFTSPMWEEYRFGDCTGKKAVLPSQTLPSAKLDENGKASYRFPLKVKDLKDENSPIEASFKALVYEPGGRARPAIASGVIDTRPWYIGIRGPEVVSAGSQVSFDWALVKPDGSLSTGEVPLVASLVFEDVNWSCEVAENGRMVWRTETRDVSVFSGRPVPSDHSGQGRYSFAAPDPEWGMYRFTIDDGKGNKTSVRFNVSFLEDVGQDPSATFSGLVMEPDRESYQVGDTASVRVSAPFTGTLWLVIQKGSILQTTVVPLEQRETTIQLPVTAALAPGVQLFAALFRPVGPEEIWAPHSAFKEVWISVRPKAKVLDVSLSVPADVVPSSKLAVSIGVTNRVSGPVSDGAVTVMAVDEALCILTDLVTPSPVDFFYRLRRGSGCLYDNHLNLMQVTDENLLGFRSHTGGDDQILPVVRLNPIKTRRFKPLSIVKENVPVRDGKATAVFDIPEFAGEVRIMAVAHTRDAVGSSEAHTRISRKIVVQPDMARCLAPGDQTELTVALFNQSPEKAAVEIAVSCEGPLAVVASPGPLVLSAKGSRTFAVPIHALGQVGAAKVILDVKTSGEHYTQTIDIPVRPAAAWETSSSSFVIPAGGSVSLGPVEDIMSTAFHQKLEVSTFPVADIRSAIDYLVSYPFDCLEQTVSRAYPFLRLASLPAGIVPDRDEYDPAVRVKAAIAHIALSRRGNHGFSMWSDYLPVHCGGSLYAIRFLAEAIRMGYDTVGMSQEVLLDMVDHIHGWSHFDESEIALCRALLGKPDFALMARLNENTELTVEQIARVAHAYFLAGDPANGRKLLDRAGGPNSLPSAAELLEAWTRLDPKAPRCAECVAFINEEKDRSRGHWMTTSRNALVARSCLASLASTGVGSTNRSIKARCEVDFNGSKDSIPFSGKEGHGALEQRRNGTLEVFNEGTGNLYLRRSIQAVPLVEKRPAIQCGLGVFRNYYTTDGQAVDISKVKRGDAIVVELVAVPTDETSDLIIEDLLPACLEVETMDLARLEAFPWIRDCGSTAIHAEARDDRVLVFPETIEMKHSFKWYYLARVITAGEYVVPALRAEAMYKPDVFARGDEKRMTVSRE